MTLKLCEGQVPCQGWTALTRQSLSMAEEWRNAVQDGDLHRVQRILRDGRVDVDRDCSSLGTALHVVSSFGNLRIMRVLLEHGADVNHQSEVNNRTVLHVCVRARRTNHHVDASSLLLEHGADPNIQDDYGQVALHSASQNHRANLIRLLMEHGATVYSKTKGGRTPLHFCRCRLCSFVARKWPQREQQG